MLRVRKDFDLENLKDYGFYNTSDKIYAYDCKSTLDNVDVNILVNSSFNTNNNEVMIYVSNDGYEEEYFDGVATIPNVIYELIIKGIIEVVEDE
jgi:hypothetical protein